MAESLDESSASSPDGESTDRDDVVSGSSSDEGQEKRSPYDASGRLRPAFLLEFPRDPELERVMQAYESGNFRAVRRLAPELAERTKDPRVRAAAQELRERIDPDPLLKLFLAAALGLLVFLVAWAYLAHHHV